MSIPVGAACSLFGAKDNSEWAQQCTRYARACPLPYESCTPTIADSPLANGSEFINHLLFGWCQGEGIAFTRGRPYKKNDQAYVEQKNWSVIRQWVGYDRYASEAAYDLLQRLYRSLCLYCNFFQPVSRLVKSERTGAKVKKQYDLAQTPLDRVRACPEADRAKVATLVALRARLDPFVLADRIDRLLERVYTLAHRRAVPGRGAQPVDGARPVDATSAPTRSLDARQTRGRPHRQPASSSTRSSVTGLMAR